MIKQRFHWLNLSSLFLMLLCSIYSANDSYAQGGMCTQFFTDEALFLVETTTPDLESFEGLTATNSFTSNSFSTPGFGIVLSNPGVNGGVWDTDFNGGFATDGDHWIRYQADANETMTFNFSSPKNAFGINITDWGDFGVGVLTFMNDAGDSFEVSVTPFPNGSEQFFGVINYSMPFTTVIFDQTVPGEAYGIDEIYCDLIPAPNVVMACKKVNLSLNEECYIIVHPSMVLSQLHDCYDRFSVDVSHHGISIGDSIPSEFIGQTLTVKVTDQITGNSCWSEVFVEDKLPPEVFCYNDTVNCLEFKMFYDTPRVVEYCQQYELKKIDESTTSYSCDTHFLKRVDQEFVAYDASGNVSDTCRRSIYIERFPLDSVMCPAQNKEIYCGDSYLTDGRGEGFPHPSVTGVPFLYSNHMSVLYGADNQGNLFRVNTRTGTADLITDEFNKPSLQSCEFGIGAHQGVTEIEFDPISKILYGKAPDGCDYGFMFDPITGCAMNGAIPTVPRRGSLSGDFQGAEVIGGVWYVSRASTSTLDIFDPLTGVFTLVGAHGGTLSFSGLAYNGTTLYGVAGQGGTGFYSIDIATGIASLIGNTGRSFGSLEFGPDGRLYAGASRANIGELYEIYPVNGSVRRIGTTGLGTVITSLALVQEPLALYPQPDFFCNLWVDYRDIDLGKAGCTRKIMRQWKTQEWWCTKDIEVPCIQFIFIIDTIGPEMTLTDSIYAKTKTGFHTCNGDVYLPDPMADDECHSIDRIDIRYPGGFISDWKGEHIELTTGFHTVTYIAYDSCYNKSEDSLVVHMQDKISPIAVCDQNTTVSLDNDGVVHVYADIFDDGSFDECVIKKMEVRRMDDPCGSGTDEWGDYVEFCCDDVNNEVMVAFRVTDKSGNSGVCMVTVLVQDKIPPRLICPPNITVDCRYAYDQNDLNVFGKIARHDSLREAIVIHADSLRFGGPAIDGLAYDGCPMTVVDSIDFSDMDNCGLGVIWRYFRAFDAQGNRTNFCVQQITFVGYNPFDSLDIIWPKNIDTSNVCRVGFFDPDDLDVETGWPRFIDEDACELVGASYKDHVIDATKGAEGCFTILRKWKVIDWCQFDGNSFTAWEHEQQIIVRNTTAPFLRSSCADTVQCYYVPDCKDLRFSISQEAIDDCTPIDELFWTYKIDLHNDGSFDSIITGTNVLTGIFPADTHRVKWIVEDLCGNASTCEQIFEIRNCKAPVAYCRTGVILDLVAWDSDNDGVPDVESVELWASDLDDGSYHDCGYKVTFSFSADITDNVRYYDCDSIGLRTTTLWITDLTNGNVSKCITSVIIQDNNNVDICPQNANGNITGLVRTEGSEEIAKVLVGLSGQAGLPLETDLTGQYAFLDMPFGGDYQVIPSKNINFENGVSTADIVEIQRFLLGMKEFNSPYKHIAADINLSGNISAADISELRKVVLGLEMEFQSGLSWRFIDAAYNFVDPKNPLQENFSEVIDLPGFNRNEQQEWVGVKLGDLNGSADVSEIGSGLITTRASQFLIAERKQLNKGQSTIVRFNADEIDGANGVQFTMHIDPSIAIVENILPLREDMTYSNFNAQLMHNGLITMSWNNAQGSVEDLSQMFALELMVLETADIEDAISISSDVTAALVSMEEGEQALGLEFRVPRTEGDEVVLYQNEPNPWSDFTKIGFYLPEAQSVDVAILDGTGRTILLKGGYFEKGDQSIEIEKSEVVKQGVLYYQLRAKEHVSVKKMVVIE